jgi:hypothetical protein
MDLTEQLRSLTHPAQPLDLNHQGLLTMVLPVDQVSVIGLLEMLKRQPIRGGTPVPVLGIIPAMGLPIALSY